MRSGLLRHRVTVQEKSGTTRNSRGKLVPTWSAKYDRIPASVETPTGREFEQIRQLVGTATDIVTIRYYADVTREHRIVFGSRVLTIGHINNVDNRDITLILTCTEET